MDTVTDVAPVSGGKGFEFTVATTNPSRKSGSKSGSSKRVYQLSAHDDATRSAWVKVLREARTNQGNQGKGTADGAESGASGSVGKGLSSSSSSSSSSASSSSASVALASAAGESGGENGANGTNNTKGRPSLSSLSGASPDQIRRNFFEGTLHRGVVTLLSGLAPVRPRHTISHSDRHSDSHSDSHGHDGFSTALDEENEDALQATGGRLQACLTARQFLAAGTEDDLCGLGDKVILAVDASDIIGVYSAGIEEKVEGPGLQDRRAAATGLKVVTTGGDKGGKGGKGGRGGVGVRSGESGESGESLKYSFRVELRNQSEDAVADVGSLGSNDSIPSIPSIPSTSVLLLQTESSGSAEQWMEAFCCVTKRLALRAVEGQPGKWKVRGNVKGNGGMDDGRIYICMNERFK